MNWSLIIFCIKLAIANHWEIVVNKFLESQEISKLTLSCFPVTEPISLLPSYGRLHCEDHAISFLDLWPDLQGSEDDGCFQRQKEYHVLVI